MEDNEFVKTPEFRRAVELINYRCPNNFGLESIPKEYCDDDYKCDDCWNRAILILYNEYWED